MRSLEQIKQDYTAICAQVGHIELQKTEVLANADKKLAPLHEQAQLLQAEARQVTEVLAELEKSKT